MRILPSPGRTHTILVRRLLEHCINTSVLYAYAHNLGLGHEFTVAPVEFELNQAKTSNWIAFITDN